jgi:hypothetical protein
VLHPGRAAIDACPVCGRPRCAEDARTHGRSGCGVCVATTTARRPASTAEVLVGAGLACLPAAYIGGPIAAEYVDDHIFALIVPALIGVGACWPALAVCHRSGRGLRRIVLAVSVFAAGCGVLGTAMGFRLYPHGPHQILSPWSLVGAPYLCAAGAALVWPYVFGPPRRPDPDEV